MINIAKKSLTRSGSTTLVVSAVIVGAVVFGALASLWVQVSLWVLAAIVAIPIFFILVNRPALGLLSLIVVSLLIPVEIPTGTEVQLNLATLLIPALLGTWLLNMVQKKDVRLVSSPVNLPLTLFLVSGVISLLIGNALWDPFIPRKSNFFLVQLAQLAIYAFSAFIFWMTPNLVKNKNSLKRLTTVFLFVGGAFAILWVLPGVGPIVRNIVTIAYIRAPFWMLLASLGGGQIIFNKHMSDRWRVFLLMVLFATFAYAFLLQRESISNWLSVLVAIAALLWMRFERARWAIMVMMIVLVLSGVLFPVFWEFAGGESEWIASGGSRLALAGRVIDLTKRNPITGLGPAAYRPYGLTTSLRYGRAYYENVALSSHNNYVDLFSQGGILMLGLFGWFVLELARIGLRLQRRFKNDFSAGYVNGMLAAGASALVIMMLADWILPFVYNIGFPGFQASLLVWMFLGGLVSLDSMTQQQTIIEEQV